MFDVQLAATYALTEDEQRFLGSAQTPEEFQEELSRFPYTHDDDFMSVRTAQQRRALDCFSGALTGAAYVYFNGFGAPLIVCVEAANGDWDHNLAVYWKNGRVGSIGASRHAELTGKPATFKSYRDLVASYYRDYNNDFTGDFSERTMRGFSAPVDLRIFGDAWLTAERPLVEIEAHLYAIPYVKLFPDHPEFYAEFQQTEGNLYYSPRDMTGERVFLPASLE